MTIFFTIISFVLNFKGVRQDAIATFYSPQTRFWELLCGSLLAWLMLYQRQKLSHIANNIDDLADPFCDDQYCYLAKNNALLYRDRGHLNDSGSRYVAPYIMNMIGSPKK